MGTLADYQVIHAGPFKLQQEAAGDGIERRWKDFDIHLPDNLVLGADKAQLIFQFEVQPSKRTTLQIEMNRRVISKEPYNKSNTRMVQVIFPYKAAVPEVCIKPNYPIRFVLDGGDIWIKDVVLWYQLHV